MKIGILADTHDLLRPEVTERLQGCELILHAGDVSSRRILDQLSDIAPVMAVRGNNDGEWAEGLPRLLETEAGGLRIAMAHKKKDLPPDLRGVDLAVYGHTHQYASEWLPGADGRRTLLLNPGSCGPRRFFRPVTLAMLHIAEDGWQAEQIRIAEAAPQEEVRRPASGDLRQLIETVIRETQRGQTVDAIAKKTGMDPALAEQIARLWLTHPGVTPEGIMAKMGL